MKKAMRINPLSNQKPPIKYRNKILSHQSVLIRLVFLIQRWCLRRKRRNLPRI